MQTDLFTNQTPITIEQLKRGTDCCEKCGQLMRAYRKVLDKRLLSMLYEIYAHTGGKCWGTFNPRDLFQGDHHKINDFQKLQYFNTHEWTTHGFISQTKKSGWWRLNDFGIEFVRGNIRVPKSSWVYNGKVVADDDELVHVSQLDERWQEQMSDFSLDFVAAKNFQKV